MRSIVAGQCCEPSAAAGQENVEENAKAVKHDANILPYVLLWILTIRKNNFSKKLPQSRLLTGHKPLKYLSSVEPYDFSLMSKCCVPRDIKAPMGKGQLPLNLRSTLSIWQQN